MAREISEADEAEHRIQFAQPGRPGQRIRAAYITAEPFPGMLAFKDHKHQVVALISSDAVLSVERLVQQGECADSSQEAGAAAAGISQYWTGLLPGTAAGFGLTRITCAGCGQQVPAECGDVAGMTPDQMVEAARVQAARECPAHETIRIGQR